MSVAATQPMHGEFSLPDPQVDPAAAQIANLVFHLYPAPEAIPEIARTISDQHLATLDVTAESHISHLANSIGRIATFPAQLRRRKQYAQAVRELDATTLWESTPEVTTNPPRTSWEILGIRSPEQRSAFIKRYFSEMSLDPGAIGQNYHEVAAWLEENDPEALTRFQKLASILHEHGNSLVLRQLVRTPSITKARIGVLQNMQGEFQYGLAPLINHGIRPLIAQEWRDGQQETYTEVTDAIEKDDALSPTAKTAGQIALARSMEDPAYTYDALAANADISLEVYATRSEGEITLEDQHLVAEINGLLTPAKLALATERFQRDYQRSDIKKVSGILLGGFLTGTGLEIGQGISHVGDWVVQLLAGTLDDVASLVGLLKSIGQKLTSDALLPAVASAATLPLVAWPMQFVTQLAESSNNWAHALSGGIFEAGALAVAAVGSAVLAWTRGRTLRRHAAAHELPSHIPNISPLVINKIAARASNPETELEEAQGLVEQSLFDHPIRYKEFWADWQKLRSTTSTEELLRLITPPKHPGLHYTREAFHDNPFQRLFSQAQLGALACGVLLFIAYPGVARQDEILGVAGATEGLLTYPLYMLQGQRRRVAFAIRHSPVGRATTALRAKIRRRKHPTERA